MIWQSRGRSRRTNGSMPHSRASPKLRSSCWSTQIRHRGHLLVCCAFGFFLLLFLFCLSQRKNMKLDGREMEEDLGGAREGEGYD